MAGLSLGDQQVTKKIKLATTLVLYVPSSS